DASPVPPEHQIRGLYVAQICVASLGATERVLTEILGFLKVDEAGEWHRFQVGAPGERGFGYLDVQVRSKLSRGRWGRGGMHHLAWRTRDENHLNALRERVAQAGLQPTPAIDRFWFRSVYFLEPGGVLFELATDGPGFSVDEDMAHLGERLVLPPWLEAQRERIERQLPPLTYPPTKSDRVIRSGSIHTAGA
ncbi:MAG: VOC family protein, partial [Armatimonadetes bacterium]|nr:VOC family protein [Armatimonadota bacterium]MDW8154930.1 VOC family protein [Armatimonadota bacterium]